MKKLLERYKKFVFGDDAAFDVQKRIFLLISHISVIIGVVGIVVDISLNLDVFLTLGTVLIVLIVLLFHIKVRNSHLSLSAGLSFFILSVIVFSFLWFYNGGYNGNNIILIFVYFIVTVTILPEKFRFIAFIVYAGLISMLTILHYNFPDLVIHYKSEDLRYVDLLLGYFMYIILAYVIQNTILKNYEAERRNVESKNDQLNLLIEKLNTTNLKLEESVKRVGELNSAKDRFITILSHDLRSPFQGLIGISRTLQNEYQSYSEEEKKFYIAQINNSLDKLYSFLDQLLAWGKLQKSELKLNLEKNKILELVNNSVDVLNEIVEQKKIIIRIDVDKNLELNVDKEMFLTVLRNLLLNAIKFSNIGGLIELSAAKNNGQAIISIKDYGVGIEKDSMEKLFKVDHIISTSGTGGEQGSGMGLILCFDIIKKHNGNIVVESEEGTGSTFTIQLPA